MLVKPHATRTLKDFVILLSQTNFQHPNKIRRVLLESGCTPVTMIVWWSVKSTVFNNYRKLSVLALLIVIITTKWQALSSTTGRSKVDTGTSRVADSSTKNLFQFLTHCLYRRECVKSNQGLIMVSFSFMDTNIGV